MIDRPTKEDYLETMGIAELLELRLRYISLDHYADDVSNIVYALRLRFDRLCGDEELKQIRRKL